MTKKNGIRETTMAKTGKKPTVSWPTVWCLFDAWCTAREGTPCSTCNHTVSDYPEWDKQQRKIQQLVNRQLE